MKKIFLLIGISLITLAGSPENKEVLILPIPAGISPYKQVWEAVCLVESGGDPLAYNEGEKSVGIAQIRAIMVRDHNQRTGDNYRPEDMFCPHISETVFLAFASQYHYSDIERISRGWNGGAKGMKKQSTIKYYNKVKELLNN